jgi:hydroxymethylpyrimidine pyrophosphatase-like HAD family hydrolase
MLRCLYVDLDGTLLGPGASLLRGADGRFSTRAVRALEACWRADVEVVPYSGRKQDSVFHASRLIGADSYIFELGAGLVLDGELEWLTGDLLPSDSTGTIYDQITALGAPELLLSRFPGLLEYHTPWSADREVSHLFRGNVDLAEAAAALAEAGLGSLRLVDNGVIPERPGLHAYHLVPAQASKARAVARHMQARALNPAECIAVGDSREDLDSAEVVGAFWLVANAGERDPALLDEVSGRERVRVATEAYGAGVYEAVVTTLAQGRDDF